MAEPTTDWIDKVRDWRQGLVQKESHGGEGSEIDKLQIPKRVFSDEERCNYEV